MSEQVLRLKSKYMNYDCILSFSKYRDSGAIAISLIAADTEHNRADDCFPGEPLATVTVNSPDYALGEHEVMLKGWSENIGLPEALEKAGIVTLTDRYYIFDSGVEGQIAILNDQYRQVA